VNGSDVIRECRASNRNSCHNRKVPVTRTKQAISDFRNIHSNLQNNSYFSFSTLNSPDEDKNSFHSPSILSDKLRVNNFKVLHQNICGIFHKTAKFLISLAETSPHVLCLTEHHLRTDELKNINLGYYTLGSQYC